MELAEDRVQWWGLVLVALNIWVLLSISPRSIIIIFSHLHPGLLSGLFPSDFLTKTFYAFLMSPMRAICPIHLILLDLIIRMIFDEVYKF